MKEGGVAVLEECTMHERLPGVHGARADASRTARQALCATETISSAGSA